jgi:hypothetical protein
LELAGRAGQRCDTVFGAAVGVGHHERAGDPAGRIACLVGEPVSVGGPSDLGEVAYWPQPVKRAIGPIEDVQAASRTKGQLTLTIERRDIYGW